MTALAALIRDELARPVPTGAHALVDRMRSRFGPALRAVLMYGSNLRRGDDREGVLDLYALVADYRSAYGNRTLAALNHLLPPNVFYLEAESDRRVVRCKYAVLTLADLPRLTARVAEPYFWARFAQPCALVWAADDEARETVVHALAGAVVTFVRFGLAFAPDPFDARALWTSAWRATYAAEIRPERADAADALYASNAERFAAMTDAALPLLPWKTTTSDEGGIRSYQVAVPLADHELVRAAWPRRRLASKARFLLRMLRNGLIFEGGADYILWKIQRHSGVVTDRSWRQKRHPLLALGAEAWRLYRARAFR
jgi:hypothetical protein